jgi:hypothetical protein
MPSKTINVVIPSGSLEPPELSRSSAPLPGLAPDEASFSKSRKAFPSRALAILLIVWLAAGIYAGANLMRVWMPHDDGLMAQSAERVMQGQVPHRDFVEIYTGGLSYLYAFAFKTFGINLASLRWMMFLFFLAWVPAVYSLASQITRDWVAGFLTLLAVAWSLPNYSAPMPSWFNLFFATFGAAALFRYIKSNSAGWLFLAGIFGGLSLIVKSVGFYYLAGVFLFLVFREQLDNETAPHATAHRSLPYSLFVIASLLCFLEIVASLIRLQFGLPEIVHFFLPVLAVVSALMWREWSASKIPGRSAPNLDRFKSLIRMAVIFVGGVLVPVCFFLVPFVAHGALADLYRGVFVLPSKRLLFAFMHPTEPQQLVPSLVLAAIIFLGFSLKSRPRLVLAVTLSAAFAFLMLDSIRDESIYGMLWHSLQGLVPVLSLIAAGSFIYFQKATDPPSPQFQQQLMLLFCLTITCGLVQFPFAAPIYFCYVAPLVLLFAAALIGAFANPPRSLLAVVAAFALVFAVVIMRPGGLRALGWRFAPNQQTAQIDLPRSGRLYVTPEQAQVYEEVIRLAQLHSGGNPIVAGPDCPEIYFLGDFQNPTRSMFEMLNDRAQYEDQLKNLLSEKSVKVLVFNSGAEFSRSYLGAMRSVAEHTFPSKKEVGWLEVYWRP